MGRTFLIAMVLWFVGCSAQPASPFQQALETLTKSLPRFSINSRERIVIYYGCSCDGYNTETEQPESSGQPINEEEEEETQEN